MIFLFDKFKTLKGTVRNRHTISLLYERERNGLYTVSAEIPIKITDKKTVYNYHKKVQDSDFLGHYDREGRFQLHKIASVDIEDSSILIKGVHLFFDEAKAGAIIQERRFRQSDIISGARVAFDSIGWTVVDFDVSDTKDYIFYNVSPLEARAILVETFGFEFDYWLDFDGKKILNKQISVKREMGKDSNKRYNYGHNVLNIKVEQDYSEIYTAVIGRGKGEDLGDDAYGRRIEYTDVEWKTPTNPMNKPLGSRTLHDENATQLFGYHEDGKVTPRTKVEIFEDIEEPEELLQATYEWLKENSVPKAVFSLKVPDGDGLDLGDKVHVIYRDIDLVKHTRVTRVVDDLVSGNRDVEFGDTAYFKTDRRLSGVKAELKRQGGSMSSRISRLKAEFDKRFEDEVQQWKDDFEQAVIDAEAAVEVMRDIMTEEFETAQREFEEEFNQSVADAKQHAEEAAEAKAKQVQDNLDSFAGRHEQLVEELQDGLIDIDGELADARADVSGILGRLTIVDGDISGITDSLTGVKDSLSEVEGTLSNTKTQLENQISDARTELEQSISNTKSELEDKIDATENALNQVGEELGKAKTDLQRQLDEARAELDGLEVGGRNLLPAFTSDKWSHQARTEIEDYSLYIPSGFAGNSILFMDVEKNTDYTMTFNSDYARYYIYEVLEDDSLGKIIRTTTGSETYTFNTEDISRIRVSINTFSGNVQEEKNIWNIKLEKGTVATDWTPAPEDTDAKISAINKLIEENQTAIATAEQSISTAEQKIEDASQTLAEHGSSISKQGVSIENIEGTLSTKASQSELDDVKGTVTQHDTSIKQNANKIASKADTSTVDTLRGTVTSQGTLITQTAEELATKASQSEVDTLKGTVKSQGTSITQNANEIASKADSSEVNALKETVTQQGTSITQNSGEIATRATKKELKDVKDGLDSDITTVNQTLTEHETSITQNAESIKSKASSTELNSLKGTVTAQGTLLTQTAEQVSSKAEKSVVDTLTGRVANTESSVTQNANEIAKKLTKTVYDSDKKDTDAKITQWSNTASETAEGLTRVIGRVSETEAGIDTAQTRIEAEAGRIDGLLSRTSNVEGKVRDAELAIEANADGLALRATKTEVEQAIDGIEVGGRNLIANSTDLKSTSSNANVTVSKVSDSGFDNVLKSESKVAGASSYFTAIFPQVTENPKVGQQATLSLLIRGTVFEGRPNGLDIYYNSGTKNQTMLGISEEYQWLSVTFDVYSDSPRFHFYPPNFSELYIARAKLEIGNIATDWTPAPEDFDASISEVTDRVTTAEAELVVQAGEISQKATQSELDRVTGRVSTAETSIIQNADEIARRLVKSDYDTDKAKIDGDITKWSNLTTETAEGLEQTISRVSTTEGKVTKAQADIKANADEIATKVSNSQFNSLSGKVSDNSSAITQTANEVKSKVTQAEVDYSMTHIENGSIKTVKDVASFHRSASVVTGAILIKTNLTGRAMARVFVKGYNYTTNSTNIDVVISFYNYSTAILQHGYTSTGSKKIERVRIFRDSNGFVNILLNDFNSTWSYPAIMVDRFDMSYVTNWSWGDDWEMSVVDSMPEDVADITEVKGQDYGSIVSKHETDIVQNAKEIALKATQSDLDSVTGRVSTAESQLSVQAGQIALRATKKELEDVDGRVSATEASLTVLDDEISSVVGRVSDNETNISSVVQDVGSITSTVATLEGDVASQGSKIEQTEDVISSKVWMDDIQNIGANLIPFSDTHNQAVMVENWEFLSDGNNVFYTGVTPSGFFTLRNTRSGTYLRMRSRLFDRLVSGKEYTLSFHVQRTSGVNQNYHNTHIVRPSDVGNLYLGMPTRITDNGDGTYMHEYVFTSDYTGEVGVDIGSYTNSGQDLWLRVKEPKLERGPKRTPYMTAFSVVEQRAEELSLRVQELSSIDGEDILSQSDISVLPDRILIGSKNIGAMDMASIISVSPSAIDIITDEMNLTGNLNVRGQIESITMSAISANFAEVQAAVLKSSVVKTAHLAAEAVTAAKIRVDSVLVNKLIANSVMANEVKALSLDAVEANIGSIRSSILTSNVIMSDNVNASLALIDKIFSENMYVRRMTGKSAFISEIQAIEITANKINGGVLSSLDQNMTWDLVNNVQNHYVANTVRFHAYGNATTMHKSNQTVGMAFLQSDGGLPRLVIGGNSSSRLSPDHPAWNGIDITPDKHEMNITADKIVFSSEGGDGSEFLRAITLDLYRDDGQVYVTPLNQRGYHYHMGSRGNPWRSMWTEYFNNMRIYENEYGMYIRSNRSGHNVFLRISPNSVSIMEDNTVLARLWSR